MARNQASFEKRTKEILSYSVGLLNQSEDIDSVLKGVVLGIHRILGFDRVRLYVITKDRRFLCGRESIGKGIDQDEFRNVKVSVRDDKVIREVLINREKKIFEPFGSLSRSSDDFGKKFAAVPILAKGSSIGMIIADNKISRKDILHDDLEMLEIFSRQISFYLDSANMKADYRKKIDDLNSIIDISVSINKFTTFSEILDYVTIKIVKMIDVMECSVYLYDKHKRSLQMETSYSLNKSAAPRKEICLSDSDVLSRAISSKKTRFVEDISRLSPFKERVLYESRKRSYLAIPLVADGKVLGIICIRTQKVEKIDDLIFKSIFGVASQTAIAMKNAMLYKNLSARVSEARLLNRINSSITKTTNVFEVVDVLKQNIEKSHHAKVSVIYVHDDSLIFDNHKSRIISGGAFDSAIRKKKMIFIEDMKKYELDHLLKNSGNAVVLMPIIENDSVSSIVQIFENDLSPERKHFYSSLNDILGIVSHNKDLYRDVRSKGLELEKMNHNLDAKIRSLNIIQKLSTGLSDIKNPDKAVETFYRYAKSLYPEERACIFFLDNSFPFFADSGYDLELLVKNMKDSNYSYGLCSTVFRTGKCVICNDVSRNKDYVRIFKETKSQFSLPIKIRGKTAGILTMESSEKNRFSNQDKVDTIKILAEQISMSLDNSILLRNLELKSEILKRRVKELFTLSKITKNIKKTTSVDETLRFITSSIVSELGFDYSAVKTFDPVKKELNTKSFAVSPALDKGTKWNSRILPDIYKITDKLIVENIYRINKDYITLEDLDRTFNSNRLGISLSKRFSEDHLSKTSADDQMFPTEDVLSEILGSADDAGKRKKGSKKKDIVKIGQINKIIFLLRDKNKFYGILSVGILYPGTIKNTEIRIFTDIANQTLIALKDAERMREISNFGEKMKVEVESKTKELQVANQQLTREKDKIRNIINLMADGLVVTDNRDRVVLVNNAFEKMFSIDRESLNDRTFSSVLDEIGAQMISQKDNVGTAEEYFIEKLKRYISIKKTDLLEREKDVGDIYIIADITKTKEINTMKTEFVSNVSHELRTPLTSIMGYAKLMLSDRLGAMTDQQKDSLKIINSESERLTRLINDVLDISKLEAGKINFDFRPGNISTLVSEVKTSFENIAYEKKINFKVHVDKNVPAVAIFDYDRIKQVYINLINNAFKFTPDKGRITVTVKSKNGFIHSSIKDTGEGIPKDNLPKLFSKFYQVDSSMTRKQGGSGLGLAISKEIIEKHHGSIDVESRLGKGSTFKFTIPLIANKLSHEMLKN